MYKKMKLKELYSRLSAQPNSSESFVANVIYTNYNKSRKEMLQGLYNIVNGGPQTYWGKCFVQFASFSLDTLIVSAENASVRSKEVSLDNLKFYAQEIMMIKEILESLVLFGLLGVAVILTMCLQENIMTTDEYVEQYILMNGYEEVADDMFECPGGHLWHYTNIEELVNDMSIAELEELEADWILQNN